MYNKDSFHVLLLLSRIMSLVFALHPRGLTHGIVPIRERIVQQVTRHRIRPDVVTPRRVHHRVRGILEAAVAGGPRRVVAGLPAPAPHVGTVKPPGAPPGVSRLLNKPTLVKDVLTSILDISLLISTFGRKFLPFVKALSCRLQPLKTFRAARCVWAPSSTLVQKLETAKARKPPAPLPLSYWVRTSLS